MSVNVDQAGATGTMDLDLNQRLSRGSFDLTEIASYLDRLEGVARIAAVRRLGARAQAHLFEAALGKRKLTLEDLVPAQVPALREVPHDGINSLPMFRRFAKVFCRPEPLAKELWGYNRTGAFLETCVGPGYYVAYETGQGEILVDYSRLPAGKCEGWPAIIANEARLSRFVYANMKDVVRGVSTHVTIGRAIRKGKVVDNWFVLCRAEL